MSIPLFQIVFTELKNVRPSALPTNLISLQIRASKLQQYHKTHCAANSMLDDQVGCAF